MNVRSGPILPVECSKSVDRGGQILPVCWVRAPSGDASPGERQRRPATGATRGRPGSGRFLPWDAATPVIEGIAGRGDVVLAVLGRGAGPELDRAVGLAAERGARVYVLASPGGGEAGTGTSWAALKKATVLVRRVPDLPVSALFAGRGEDAGIAFGDHREASCRWWLRLNASQGADLYRLFLHLFWNEAVDEAWTGEGALKFGPPREAPFDALPPGDDAGVRLVPLGQSTVVEEAWIAVAASGHLPEAPSIRRLLVPPSGAGQEGLVPRLRQGTEIAWNETGLPDCSVSGSGGVLQCSGAKRAVRIVLDGEQASDLSAILERALVDAPWRLRADAMLSDIEGDVWLPGAAGAAALVPEEPIACGAVPAASLRDMPSTEPGSLPAPSPLALRTTWRWTVSPPRLPEKTREDPLIASWRQFDEEVSRRIEHARSALKRIEDQEGVVQKAFAALAGPILGFGGTRKRLIGELDTLAKSAPSVIGPASASTLLRDLAVVEGRVATLDADLGDAERKAREDQDREEQRQAWEKAREAARRDLDTARQELAHFEADRARVEDILPRLNRGEYPEGLSKKDAKALRHQSEDELGRLRKEIPARESRIREAEKVLARPFEFHLRPAARAGSGPGKGAASGAKFVPTAPLSKVDNVPAEALPAAGTLVRAQDRRYLAISRWEDLEVGEREAGRLKASLVAGGRDG